MTPYLAMLAVPGVLALTGMRRVGMLFVLVALLYWLMVGFRFRVGMDWDNYLSLYQIFADDPVSEAIVSREPGFRLLYKLGELLGGGYIFVNVISALIFCWGFFVFARRCFEPYLAIVVGTPLLVVAFAMSGIRQAVALGIITFLFATWDKRNAVGRVVIVLIAATFHFSALFILMFVALGARISPFAKISAAIAVGLVIALITYFAPTSMEAYSSLYVAGPRRLSAPGAPVQVGALAVPAILYLMVRKRWLQVHGEHLLYVHLALAAIALLPVIPISSVGAYRFALYLWPMSMYVLSGLPGLIASSNERQLYRVLIVIAFVGVLIGWLTLANTSWAWLPYQNWLFLPEGQGLGIHRR
jgi:hypothetical protein